MFDGACFRLSLIKTRGRALAGTLMDNDSKWIWFSWGPPLLLFASIISIVFIVFVLVKLPATYFQDGHSPVFSSLTYHPRLRWLACLARNMLGVILIVLGVCLSLPGVPGQGLLTILIGLMLIDIPGKRRLERKFVERPKVLRAINRMRGRFGKPPLILNRKLGKDDEHHDSARSLNGEGTPSSHKIILNGPVEQSRACTLGAESRD